MALRLLTFLLVGVLGGCQPPPGAGTPTDLTVADANVALDDADVAPDADAGIPADSDAGWPGTLTLTASVDVPASTSYPTMAFCRLMYVAAKDKLVLTANTDQQNGVRGYNYHWYDASLVATGEEGMFETRPTGDYAITHDDAGFFFFLSGNPGGGWRILKYDDSFNLLAQTTLPTGTADNQMHANEMLNDQMIALAGGQLDVSSLLAVSDAGPSPTVGEATHHRFLTRDLGFVTRREATQLPHINGTSLLFVNGQYHLLTTTAWFGHRAVLHFDANWSYLGSHTLDSGCGHFAEGFVFKDGRYYATWTGTPCGPGSSQIQLAVFDESWNRVQQNIAVPSPAGRDPDRSWLVEHDGKLHVSFDSSTRPAPGGGNPPRDWTCHIRSYEWQ